MRVYPAVSTLGRKSSVNRRTSPLTTTGERLIITQRRDNGTAAWARGRFDRAYSVAFQPHLLRSGFIGLQRKMRMTTNRELILRPAQGTRKSRAEMHLAAGSLIRSSAMAAPPSKKR